MTYEETKNQGLKEFDEEFVDGKDWIVRHNEEEPYQVTPAHIKSFLTSFAEKIRESVVGEMIEKIERMKYPQSVIDEYDEFNSRDEAIDKGNTIGFNSAISNLLAQLKDK